MIEKKLIIAEKIINKHKSKYKKIRKEYKKSNYNSEFPFYSIKK